MKANCTMCHVASEPHVHSLCGRCSALAATPAGCMQAPRPKVDLKMSVCKKSKLLHVQVHLVHEELFEELAAAGFTIGPHAIGENITTHGLPLLQLPTGRTLVSSCRDSTARICAFEADIKAHVLMQCCDESSVSLHLPRFLNPSNMHDSTVW